MDITKFQDSIYYVGVQNPNLKIFDVIMPLKHGTTYNSYLIKSFKNALIECVQEDFFDEYLNNITSIMPISNIDYIIINHTEPDHSGALNKLLEINPDITVVATKIAINFLKEMLNKNFKSLVIEDNLKIDLGNNNILTFSIAPLLHWPDSCFTFLENQNVAFTCDFLGTHYASKELIDENIKNKEEYVEAYKYYYECIFSPFKENVAYGLEQLKKHKFTYIMPGHGPILKKNIKKIIDFYTDSCKPTPQLNQAVIVFVSAYGYTKQLSEMIKTQLKNENYNVLTYNLVDKNDSEIINEIYKSKILLLGSPTINADILKPISDLLSSLNVIKLRKLHAVAAFGSYGWSGEAVPMLTQRFKDMRLKTKEGIRVKFKPNDEDMAKIQNFIKDIVI